MMAAQPSKLPLIQRAAKKIGKNGVPRSRPRPTIISRSKHRYRYFPSNQRLLLPPLVASPLISHLVLERASTLIQLPSPQAQHSGCEHFHNVTRSILGNRAFEMTRVLYQGTCCCLYLHVY